MVTAEYCIIVVRNSASKKRICAKIHDNLNQNLLLISIKLSTVNFYRKILLQCKILGILLCNYE